MNTSVAALVRIAVQLEWGLKLGPWYRWIFRVPPALPG